MRVVVVGSGAREHAIVASLVKDHEVVATPGNPGIEEICEVTDKDPESIDAALFVIGPEVPLVAGLADRLRANKKLVFGPVQDGAALEGSKAFMKQVLHDAKVPTAGFSVFSGFNAALLSIVTGDSIRPDATSAMSCPRSEVILGKTTCASGSPKRTLYSTSLGPTSVIIRPA